MTSSGWVQRGTGAGEADACQSVKADGMTGFERHLHGIEQEVPGPLHFRAAGSCQLQAVEELVDALGVAVAGGGIIHGFRGSVGRIVLGLDTIEVARHQFFIHGICFFLPAKVRQK